MIPTMSSPRHDGAPSRELAARFEAYSDWRRRLSAGISRLHEWLAEQELADASIDLKSEAGKAVFLDLVRHADVVFDNFSVGVTERLGIDHASLSKVNPRIVTCSVTGFGQSGPETHRPAFDQVVQAMRNALHSWHIRTLILHAAR